MKPDLDTSQGFFKGGLLHSPIPGRTDHLPLDVQPESYVMPADVVSGLGQGNTMAGGHILDGLFRTHLKGALRPHLGRLLTPHKGGLGDAMAKGGHVEKVPVILAGGEYVVPKEVIASIGNGDVGKGHDILDKVVAYIRKHTIKTLSGLPSPKK